MSRLFGMVMGMNSEEIAEEADNVANIFIGLLRDSNASDQLTGAGKFVDTAIRIKAGMQNKDPELFYQSLYELVYYTYVVAQASIVPEENSNTEAMKSEIKAKLGIDVFRVGKIGIEFSKGRHAHQD